MPLGNGFFGDEDYTKVVLLLLEDSDSCIELSSTQCARKMHNTIHSKWDWNL